MDKIILVLILCGGCAFFSVTVATSFRKINEFGMTFEEYIFLLFIRFSYQLQNKLNFDFAYKFIA